MGGRILGEGQPKYLNSPQTPLFDKSTVLYGLDQARQAIRREEQVIIVEGYTDAVIAHQHGYTNVVAALGTALTAQQVRQLRRYSQNLVLALDADSAGQAATLRGLDVMHEALASGTVPGIQGEVRVATLPSGRDPDDVIRADPQQWETLIEQAKPFVEFAIDAAVAGGRSQQRAREVRRGVSRLPAHPRVGDPIARAPYVAMLAERLGVDEQTVQAAMAASRRRTPRRSTRRDEPPPPGEAGASVLLEQPRAGSPEALEKLERHCLIALLSAPDLLADPRLPTDRGRLSAAGVPRDLPRGGAGHHPNTRLSAAGCRKANGTPPFARCSTRASGPTSTSSSSTLPRVHQPQAHSARPTSFK